jgi:hypothetical protein
MVVLILGKADVVVFVWRVCNYFTLSSSSAVESCVNPTDTGLTAFYLCQLLQEVLSICALITTLWPAMLKFALQVHRISSCDFTSVKSISLQAQLNTSLLFRIAV